MSKEQAKM
jgi:hypothetical protein